MALPPLSPEFRQYYEDIITHSRFARLQGEKRERKITELRYEMSDIQVHEWVNALSPTDRKVYDRMLKDHVDGETRFDYLEAHVPNMDQIDKEVLAIFPRMYMK